MKLKKSAILVLVAATSMAVACGKKKKGSSDSSAEQPPAAEPANPPAEEKPADPSNQPSAALYVPVNLPASFSLPLPGSLAISQGGASLCLDGDDGCGGGDGMEAPEASEPSKDNSHGLSELRYQLDDLRWRLKDYTQTFAAVDTQITAHKADCDDGCEIKDAKATITQEMVNLMIENAGGAEAFDAEGLAEVKKYVGQEYPIGTITVEHPTTDPNGFTTIIHVVSPGEGSDQHDLTLSFNKVGDAYGKSRVKEHATGAGEQGIAEDMPADAAEPAKAPEAYTVDYQIDYDAIAQAVNVTNNSDYSGFKYKNSFKFSADPKKKDVHGTTFAVVIDQGDSNGSGYNQSTTGYADDAGAYLETIYSYDVTTATFTKSAAPVADKSYEIYLGDITAADLNDANAPWQPSIGGFDTQADYYYGPQPAPAASEFKVFEATYGTEAEDFKVTYAASSISITAVALNSSRMTSGYSEQVGAKGEMIAYCYYDTVVDNKLGASTFCSSGYDDEYAYATSYAGYEGEDGSFEVKGSVAATLSNVDMTVLKGNDFYIVRKQANIDTYAKQLRDSWDSGADNSAVSDQVLGYGSYTGKAEYDAAAEPNEVYNIDFWGDVAAAADAQILLLSYDDDFNLTLMPIGAKVSAAKVD